MFSTRFINWVVYRPWMAIAVSLLAVLLMSIGIKDYSMTNNPRSFFGEGNPEFERLKSIEAQYGNREMVVFIVHPADNNIFSRDTLSLLETLTDEAWKMPAALRSSSLVNFQHTVVQGDELSTRSLVENAQALTDAQLAEIRRIALAEPALLHSAVSEKGHVATVAVSVTMDEERSQATAVAEWSRALRDRLEQQYPQIDIQLTGTVVFSDAMKNATLEGLTETFPLSMLAAIIVLWIVLRSFLGMFYTMLVVYLSVLGAIGLSVALGIVFQPVTSFGPAIILTLSIADSMHLLISYQQNLSKAMSKADAMVESLRVNLQPVILTSVTTLIGFLSLNASDSPPFRDLGNVVAIGVTLALWLSLVFLPALCMVSPAPRIRQGEGQSQRWMMKLTEWIIRRRASLVIVMLVFMIVPSLFVTKNELADVWNEYFDDTYEVRRANDFMTAEMSGLHRLEMSIPAKDEGGIVDPEYLTKLDALRAWAEAQPEVVYAVSFSDVIRRLNRDMNEGDPEYYRIPEDRALASQYLLMFEMSLPFGLGLDNAITMGKDATLFAVVLNTKTSGNVLELKKRTDQWIKENFPDYMQVQASGLDVMFAGATERNIRSLISGMAFSFGLITLCMMLSLRSFKYGVYSMLPNIAPCAMAFGIWALLHGRVGLTDSIVACITLGIVVDDTIHFLSKYVRARREMGFDADEAVRYSLTNVGVAIVGTTLVLIANFAVLMTSHFYPSNSMGFLTCLTLAIALLIDLLFLPPLLLLFDKRKEVEHENAASRVAVS